MNKIRLQFIHVSEIVGSDNLALLTLTDMERERQLSIVCDKAMAIQLDLRVKKNPIRDMMLPEVMGKVLSQWGGIDLELLIQDIDDGQYKTFVVNRSSLEMIPIRASDAVLMHITMGVPLFINENLMERQSVLYNAKSHGVAIPVNSLNDDMLDSALQRAISTEDYELASRIRDEKMKRKKDLNIE